MAEATVPTNIEEVELTLGKTLKETDCSYVLGHFLSIKEVSTILTATATERKRPLSDHETKMTEALERVKYHHFQHTQVPIPISNLQHVSRLSSVLKICEEGGFRANVWNANQESFRSEAEEPRPEPRPEFDDLLFWSAGISSEDIETAKREAYDNVMRVISPSDAHRFEGEIREQFGNSPAFREASRYGNFRFSFPLSYLLGKYKDQHCGGGEPQMRILKTELHKQEIAHYIVIHSPSTTKFNDFPEVPTVQGSSVPLPFVYWMDETLYWRPESTADLNVKILESGRVRKECCIPCDYFTMSGDCFHKIFSVWNHVIFAFHLPEDQLKIPIEDLREHLTACAGDKPFLAGITLEIEEAESYVKIVKDQNTVIRSTKTTAIARYLQHSSSEVSKFRYLICQRSRDMKASDIILEQDTL